MFQFKQFLILQDKTPMKVCTDACLFGAWVPIENTNTILDIGTGTGLLALMAAQRSSAHITAIEPDGQTYHQAQENVTASSWHQRILLVHQSLEEYVLSNQLKSFDTILCNPPFFSNSIISLDRRKAAALHQTTLTHETLAKGIQQLLSPTGQAFVLTSVYETKRLLEACNKEALQASVVLEIWATPIKYIRTVVLVQKKTILSQVEKMIIKSEDNTYTDLFKKILQPYYLHF
jgi:tRNA1Val (adenine37-N6)-methyltransferase